MKEATKEQIEEAIKEHWCPFCKDSDRKFSIKSYGWQELRWEQTGDKKEFEEDWGDTEMDEDVQDVLCVGCGEYVPSEVWKEWFE